MTQLRWVFVLLCASSAMATPPPTTTVEATWSEGAVTTTTDGGPETPLSKKKKKKTTLTTPVTVTTGPDARVELRFPDGSIVRLGPGSQLRVDHVAFQPKTREAQVQLDLVSGAAWANVSPLIGNDAYFRTKTRDAAFGVRGTVYRLNVDDNAVVLHVYDGAVAVGGVWRPRPPPTEPYNRPQPPDPPDDSGFELLLGRMMRVRVGANQRVPGSAMSAFKVDDDTNDPDAPWVLWNQQRDVQQKRAPKPLPKP